MKLSQTFTRKIIAEMTVLQYGHFSWAMIANLTNKQLLKISSELLVA